jgi:hypothetical protein
MYKDLKTQYWCFGMKQDVAEYVALCDTCQRVKVEHRTLETCRITTTSEDSRVEVGRNYNGFHSLIATYAS